MLTALWYTLLFMLQVVQMDGNTDYSRLEMDVFVDSVPVWTVTVKGNAREGQLWAGKQLLGVFDASDRLTQAYLIRPQADLPEGVGDKKDSASKDAGKTASPTPRVSTDPGAGDKKELPPVLALDFTGLVRQLRSHPDQGIQVLVPDLAIEGKDSQKSTPAKASPVPSPKANPGPLAGTSASPRPGSSASPSVSASPAPDGPGEDVMQLHRYPNRIVLAWPSQGIVVVVTRR